jgi:hypothetical protein
MHEEEEQCILYCSTYTIPVVIKLFSLNVKFSQNQLLTIAKSFRYFFDITNDSLH